MKNSPFLLVLIISIVSCSSKKETSDKNNYNDSNSQSSNLFKPDFNDIADKIVVESGKDSDITLPSGSVLHIPKNTFEDESGNKITGKVNLTWKEYHSLEEVIISNITMKYDSAGTSYNFETGGMFTIMGFQKDKPVFISKTKSITIDIASTNPKETFNFYQLDTLKNNWNYITTEDKLTKAELKLSQQKPTNVLSKNILDVQVNTVSYPELANKNILGWRLKSSFKQENNTMLSYSKFQAYLNKRMNDSTYQLKLKNLQSIDNRDYTFNVSPFTYEEAKKESEASKQLAHENEREISEFVEKESEGKTMRRIAIFQFGTYNFDCIKNQPNAYMVKSTFEFPENTNKEQLAIYFMCPEDRIVVQCNPFSEIVKFYKNKKNLLIAITDKNELLYCNSGQFAESIDKEAYTFHFESTHEHVSNEKDIADLIKQI
jgi:hypothetical protein